jgi:hypothetical protein
MRDYEKLQRLGQGMIALTPMRARYHGLLREFCPHALGYKNDSPSVWRAFSWQFGGESEHGDLPAWRCFLVRDLEDLQLAPGVWHKGSITAHGIQECIDRVEAHVDPAHTAAKFVPEQIEE